MRSAHAGRADVSALAAIQKAWTRTDLSFAQRVKSLQQGLPGGIALDGTTVFDDGKKDNLSGGSGLDWIFAGTGDRLSPEHWIPRIIYWP